MTSTEIREQIEFASRVVEQWPAWKRNILMHSSEPTNSSARQPVIASTSEADSTDHTEAGKEPVTSE